MMLYQVSRVSRVVRDAKARIVAVSIDGWSSPVLDVRMYLSGAVKTKISDILEDNTYWLEPYSLDDLKPIIRKRLGSDDAPAPVLDSEIEALSWYLGRRVTRFYHGIDVDLGRYIGPGVPCDLTPWFTLTKKLRHGSREWHRWVHNQLLIGKWLEDALVPWRERGRDNDCK